ncbi:restriction endonuclease subunit S, partial [Enterococcus faecalis]|nr:restriction endonuclease subunit S [Enterococcus faecalis]
MIDTKALREKILDLAMRGKLVPQDPNDEPASELLKRIKAEKEELIKQKKIKRDKNETEIFRGDDGLHYEKFADGTVNMVETPYDLPQGWEWVRLRTLITYQNGKAFKSSSYVKQHGFQVIRLGNVKNNKMVLGASPIFISEQDAKESLDYKIFEDDILVTMTGTKGKTDFFYTTKINSFDLEDNELFLNQRVGIIRPISSGVSPDFLNHALKEGEIKKYVFNSATGTANQSNISTVTINNILIPVPPIEEQLKINDLLSDSNQKLDSIDKEQSDIQFLANQLKQKVLDVAMQGKLVPQDPNDEPASVLLEKIRAEKQRLFEEGKIKKKDLVETEIVK